MCKISTPQRSSYNCWYYYYISLCLQVKCYVSNEFKHQFSLKKEVDVDIKGCTEYTLHITKVSDDGLTGELDGQGTRLCIKLFIGVFIGSPNNFRRDSTALYICLISEILIPTYHLNDHLALCQSLLKHYSAGCRVVGAIFLHIQQGKPIFTLRDSITTFFKVTNH